MEFTTHCAYFTVCKLHVMHPLYQIYNTCVDVYVHTCVPILHAFMCVHVNTHAHILITIELNSAALSCFPISKSSIKKTLPTYLQGSIKNNKVRIPVVTNILTLPTLQGLILKYLLSTASPLLWGFRAPVVLPVISHHKGSTTPGTRAVLH